MGEITLKIKPFTQCHKILGRGGHVLLDIHSTEVLIKNYPLYQFTDHRHNRDSPVVIGVILSALFIYR